MDITIILFPMALLILLLNVWPSTSRTSLSKSKLKTLVIMPCKGIDISLHENISRAKAQSYANFDFVCVVDSLEEPALAVIRKAGAKYIVAAKKDQRSSGKVNAIYFAIKSFPGYLAYALLDSDVTVSKDWLSMLLSPLNQRTVGISTAYPFFDPWPNFWSKLKSVWSTVGESLLEREVTRFGWGGSLAFRRELLDKNSLKEFRYSVSDDMALTKICKSKNLKIHYIGSNELAVKTKENFTSFFEWSNRQTSIFLASKPYIFPIGIGFYTSELILLFAGIIKSMSNPLYLMLLLPAAFGTWKMYSKSRQKSYIIFVIGLLLPLIYLLNLLVSISIKKIEWRGSTYTIK